MKTPQLFIRFFCVAALCGATMLACDSNDPNENPDPQNGGGGLTTADLDNVSNQFKLQGSSKIVGSLPSVNAGTSLLKYDVKDTLRLPRGIYIPVRFLHDLSTDVKGAFIQVTADNVQASFYYDIPELPDLAENDSTSAIMIRYDQTGSTAQLPSVFTMVILPYNQNHQPIDRAIVPVRTTYDAYGGHPNGRVEESKNTEAICGLTGGYWAWRASYILSDGNDGSYTFYNDPYKTWGKEGQVIWGSCCGGTSIYGPCPGDPNQDLNKALVFYTFSKYKEERLFLFDNSFSRKTFHSSAVPLPDSTNFCAAQYGVIEYFETSVDYQGNLTITEVVVPDRLQKYYHTRNKLLLEQTSQNPDLGGYGNPGGIIHELTCDELILIQLDPEGSGMDLYKLYYHTGTGVDEEWFTLHSF